MLPNHETDGMATEHVAQPSAAVPYRWDQSFISAPAALAHRGRNLNLDDPPRPAPLRRWGFLVTETYGGTRRTSNERPKRDPFRCTLRVLGWQIGESDHLALAARWWRSCCIGGQVLNSDSGSGADQIAEQREAAVDV